MLSVLGETFGSMSSITWQNGSLACRDTKDNSGPECSCFPGGGDPESLKWETACLQWSVFVPHQACWFLAQTQTPRASTLSLRLKQTRLPILCLSWPSWSESVLAKRRCDRRFVFSNIKSLLFRAFALEACSF